MVAVGQDDTVEAAAVGAAFGQLFDECFQEFCRVHVFETSLQDGEEKCTEHFVIPRSLVARLLHEAPMPLGDDLVGGSSPGVTGETGNILKQSCATNESCDNTQRDINAGQKPGDDWSTELLQCFLLLARVYSQLRLTSPNESLEEISTPLLRQVGDSFSCGLKLNGVEVLP